MFCRLQGGEWVSAARLCSHNSLRADGSAGGGRSKDGHGVVERWSEPAVDCQRHHQCGIERMRCCVNQVQCKRWPCPIFLCPLGGSELGPQSGSHCRQVWLFSQWTGRSFCLIASDQAMGGRCWSRTQTAPMGQQGGEEAGPKLAQGFDLKSAPI